MGVIMNFLDKIFGKEMTSIHCQEKIDDIAAQTVIYNMAVNRIASTFSRAEFRTFKKNKSIKENDYYLFNVAPSINYDGVSFKRKMIEELLFNGEVLIPFVNRQYLIAESFDKKVKTMLDWEFRDVVVDGYKLEDTFYMKDVIYIQLNVNGFKKYLDSLNGQFAELLGVAKSQFIKSGGIKGFLQVPGNIGSQEAQAKYRDSLNKSLQSLSDQKNAVIPLQNKEVFQNLSDRIETLQSAREFRNVLDDQIELTGMALGIPPNVLTMALGERDEQYNFYLSECIDSFKVSIESAFNKKVYKKDQYLKGDRMLVDTTDLKHIDLFDVGTSVDKLIGSSVVNPNEIRDRLGLDLIDEPWAKEHVRTKNYGLIGEENETIPKQV